MPEEETLEQEATEQPVGRRRWIPIAVGAAALLALGVAAAVWATGMFDGSAEAGAASEPSRAVNEVIAFEPVVVNLASAGRMNYARIGVSLGVHNPSPGQAVFNEEILVPKVKDRLLSLVGGMDSGQLLRAEAKEELKREVLTFVNEMVGDGPAKVVEVYFTDFIIQ